MKVKIFRRSLIVVLVMMVVCASAAFAETPTKAAAEVYPATPEGVVKAFVERDFGGGPYSWEQLEGKYTTWPDGPGYDGGYIVAGFKITKIKENLKTADVKVEYKSVGEYYFDAIGPVFKEAKKNEIVIFKLVKKGNLWKIESPQLAPHIGTKKVIEHLKLLSEGEENSQKKKQINQVLKHIKDKLKRFGMSHKIQGVKS